MKKRSSTKQPEPIFFTDRNLGKKFPIQLREHGFKVVSYFERYTDGTVDDVRWIPEVTKKGWYILTFDKEIGRNQLEIDVLMKCGGRAYIPKGRMHPEIFAEWLVRSRHNIERHINKQNKLKNRAYMAKVCPVDSPLKPGKIETWINEARWKERAKERRSRMARKK